MQHRGYWPWVSTLVALVLGLSGCGGGAPANASRGQGDTSSNAAPPIARAVDPLDPCLNQLQDLCGPLILYYRQLGHLPESLDELQKVDPSVKLVCPVSKTQYIYEPSGLVAPNLPGAFVIIDSQPVHAGMRLGVLVEQLRPGMPLVTHVLPVPPNVRQAPQ